MSTHLSEQNPRGPRSRACCRGSSHVEGLPIILVFIILVVFFMIAAPQVFLGWPIYLSFLTTVPPMLVLAIGLTLVVAAGEIDLSFPSTLAFSGFLFSICETQLGSPWLGVLAALAGGALIGVVNGTLVAVVGVPSIIVTIGTQFFWAGAASILSGGQSDALQESARQRRSTTSSPATSSASCRCRRSGRFAIAVVHVVHPQPPPLRRARAVHR